MLGAHNASFDGLSPGVRIMLDAHSTTVGRPAS
jgi:hypothetical protein